MNARQTSFITLIAGLLLILAFILHLNGYLDYRQIVLVIATIIAGTPIAMVGALFIGEYVESAAVTFLFLFGAYLEARTLEKTRSSLKILIDMAPSEATVLKDGKLQTADIALMADRLDQFSHAYGLAKATTSNMKQNTFFAVGTVILLLIGVLFGKIFLASGMLIHELSILVVVLNALRLVKYKPSEERKVEVEPIISS